MVKQIVTRSHVGLVLGLLAAGLGLYAVLPTIGSTFQSAGQLFVTEFPWFTTLFAFAIALWGLRRRAGRRVWSAVTLGAAGVFFAIQPLLQALPASDDLDTALRDGLGADYAPSIPAVMQNRMAGAAFSPLVALGARNFGVQANVTNDVPFADTPSRTLKLDVYQPLVDPVLGDRYPAVIVIHGGSWRYLDKGEFFVPHNRYLASQGYVVFDIQYRLSDEASFPAQLQDVACAVSWVKANADTYRVDTANVALLGRSAGAHLALLAGYRPNDPTVDVSGCGAQATSVQAVVGIYAPTDMRLFYVPPGSVVADFVGGLQRDVPDAYRDASPTTFARAGVPATLLVQGYMDNIVPPAHAELLLNLLRAADVPAVLVRLPWARHGYDALIGGLGSQLTQYAVDRFLAWSFYHDQ